MTPEQLATLNAHIDASSDLNAHPNTPDGNVAVAALLNATASPDFWVWRREVDPADYLAALDWTEVDNIAAAKARIWEWLTGNGTRPIHPTSANERAGILQAFTQAAAPNTRAALIVLGRRQATRIEKLLATGTGSTASPASLGFESPVSGDEVQAARDLP